MISTTERDKMEFYVDMKTGVYGDTDDLLTIDLTNWSQEDIDLFTDLPDNTRISFVNFLINFDENQEDSND